MDKMIDAIILGVISSLIATAIYNYYSSSGQNPTQNSHVVQSSNSNVIISNSSNSVTISNVPNTTFPDIKIPDEINIFNDTITDFTSDNITISFSGSNNNLRLSQGGKKPLLSNMSMSGSNTDREISIPKNQAITLRLSGSNNTIGIQESIFTQVQIYESGSNNQVVKIFNK